MKWSMLVTILAIMLVSFASCETMMREVTVTYPDGRVEVIREPNAEMVALYVDLFREALDRIDSMSQDSEPSSEAYLAREQARLERFRLILEALRDSGFQLPTDVSEKVEAGPDENVSPSRLRIVVEAEPIHT